MNAVLVFALTNAVIATGMFAIVALLKSRFRNPAILHALWTLALLKLLTPPFWTPQLTLLPSVRQAHRNSTPAALFSKSPAISPSSLPPSAAHQIPSASPRESGASLDTQAPDPLSPRDPRVEGWHVMEIFRWSWVPIFMVVWGAGTLFIWGLSLYRIGRFNHYLRFAEEAPAEIQETTIRLAEQLGLKRCPRVWQVPSRVSPMLWAFLSPARIVVPCELLTGLNKSSRQALLLHELVHFRRGDPWIRWLELIVLGLYWWHPIAWLIHRELRTAEELACDAWVVSLLPDDRSTYAKMLVTTVAFLSPDTAPILATGVGTSSNLEGRVRMIMRASRDVRVPIWMKFGLCLLAVLLLPLSPVVVRAQRIDEQESVERQTLPVLGSVPTLKGARTWEGQILEKGTHKPIAEADVLVKISRFKEGGGWDERTILRDVALKTDAEGQYKFTITPEVEAETRLYIELTVTSRDHVRFYGGCGYGLILKDEQLGERPFWEQLELAPGNAIEGLVKTPEGKPAAGVKVAAYSAHTFENWYTGDRSHTETTTDVQGRFHLVVLSHARAVLWILPQDYALEKHGLTEDQRGDLGTFNLDIGKRLTGRVLDPLGRPVVGVYVDADIEEDREESRLVPNFVSDQIRRTAVTSDDGSFEFRPLPAGTYNVDTTEQPWDPSAHDEDDKLTKRPLANVFTVRKVSLQQGEAQSSVEIRALPHIVVEGQRLNTKGEKYTGANGEQITICGLIDKEFWVNGCQSASNGSFRMLVPKGLRDAKLSTIVNEKTALRFRKNKEAKLQAGREFDLDRLSEDTKDLEVFYLESPTILISATARDGTPIPGWKPRVDYMGPKPKQDGVQFLFEGAIVPTDVGFSKQKNGKVRTTNLFPDREVEVTVQAAGFEPASRKMSLPEGKTEEVEFVLKPL